MPRSCRHFSRRANDFANARCIVTRTTRCRAGGLCASTRSLTPVVAHGMLSRSGRMKLRPNDTAICWAASPGRQRIRRPPTRRRTIKIEKAAAPVKAATDAPGRADAYHYFNDGVYHEQQYAGRQRRNCATQDHRSVQEGLRPRSEIADEWRRLAEIYWKARRIAKRWKKPTRIFSAIQRPGGGSNCSDGLIARAGTLARGAGESEIVAKAIEQFGEIYRVIRKIWSPRCGWRGCIGSRRRPRSRAGAARDSRHNTDNEAAVEQLTQLSLDEGRIRKPWRGGGNDPPTQFAGVASPYWRYVRQGHDRQSRSGVPRLWTSIPPEPSHQRGLGRTLPRKHSIQKRGDYRKLEELTPGRCRCLCGSRRSTANCIMDEAEEELVKAAAVTAGQFLEVMYDEAML